MQSRGFGRAYTRALGAGWRLVAPRLFRARRSTRRRKTSQPSSRPMCCSRSRYRSRSSACAARSTFTSFNGCSRLYRQRSSWDYLRGTRTTGANCSFYRWRSPPQRCRLRSSALHLPVAQYGWLPLLEIYWEYFDYLAITWSVVVIVVAIWRLVGRAQPEKTIIAVVALVLLVAPNFWAPQGLVWAPRPDESAGVAASFHSLAEESAFYAQQDALEPAGRSSPSGPERWISTCLPPRCMRVKTCS